MAVFTIIDDLRGNFVARLVVIVDDKSRHIMFLTASHKVHTLIILWISHPFSILQSIGKFIVTTDILQFFWCWVLMKSLWSMQVTIIDFNHSLCRIDKRRVEIILLIRLPIDYDRQFNVDIPKSSAKQLSSWIVERRGLSVVTKLTSCSVEQVNRECKLTSWLHEFDKTFEAHRVCVANESAVQLVDIAVVIRQFCFVCDTHRAHLSFIHHLLEH